MHFAAEHRFAAPVDAVIAGLTDPAFHRGLQLPDLKLLDVDVPPQPVRDRVAAALRLRRQPRPLARAASSVAVG